MYYVNKILCPQKLRQENEGGKISSFFPFSVLGRSKAQFCLLARFVLSGQPKPFLQPTCFTRALFLCNPNEPDEPLVGYKRALTLVLFSVPQASGRASELASEHASEPATDLAGGLQAKESVGGSTQSLRSNERTKERNERKRLQDSHSLRRLWTLRWRRRRRRPSRSLAWANSRRRKRLPWWSRPKRRRSKNSFVRSVVRSFLRSIRSFVHARRFLEQLSTRFAFP